MELKLPDLVVREPRNGEGTRLTALYRLAFAERVPGVQLRPRFHTEDTVVAAIGHRLIGLGCTDPARADLDPHLACLQPETRGLLESLGEGLDEPVALTVLAPPGLVVARRPGDRLFCAVAVDPAFRRRGIGRALAIARLRQAHEDGVRQVFVHCVDGSGSTELYRQLGFVALVHAACHYRDGTGMTLLFRDSAG